MSDDSLGKGQLAKKGWGIPGALFLGVSAFLLPNVLLIFLVPDIQRLVLSPNITNFLYEAIFEALVIMTLYIFVRAYGLRLRDLGLVKFKWRDLGLVALGFAVYFAVSLTISSLVQVFVKFDPNQSQDIGFNAPNSAEFILVFIAIAVLAPLAEELLFRGFIFRGMRQKLPFWPAALIVSLLFALAHGQVNVGLDVFALSIVLCWLREKTGSLWPGIILHASKNALALILIFVLGVG